VYVPIADASTTIHDLRTTTRVRRLGKRCFAPSRFRKTVSWPRVCLIKPKRKIADHRQVRMLVAAIFGRSSEVKRRRRIDEIVFRKKSHISKRQCLFAVVPLHTRRRPNILFNRFYLLRIRITTTPTMTIFPCNPMDRINSDYRSSQHDYTNIRVFSTNGQTPSIRRKQ